MVHIRDSAYKSDEGTSTQFEETGFLQKMGCAFSGILIIHACSKPIMFHLIHLDAKRNEGSMKCQNLV